MVQSLANYKKVNLKNYHSWISYRLFWIQSWQGKERGLLPFRTSEIHIAEKKQKRNRTDKNCLPPLLSTPPLSNRFSVVFRFKFSSMLRYRQPFFPFFFLLLDSTKFNESQRNLRNSRNLKIEKFRLLFFPCIPTKQDPWQDPNCVFLRVFLSSSDCYLNRAKL